MQSGLPVTSHPPLPAPLPHPHTLGYKSRSWHMQRWWHRQGQFIAKGHVVQNMMCWVMNRKHLPKNSNFGISCTGHRRAGPRTLLAGPGAGSAAKFLCGLCDQWWPGCHFAVLIGHWRLNQFYLIWRHFKKNSKSVKTVHVMQSQLDN